MTATKRFSWICNMVLVAASCYSNPATAEDPPHVATSNAAAAAPLRADAVQLRGGLGKRHSVNGEYLMWRYREIEHLLFPFRQRALWSPKRKQDWDGEFACKFLDAAVLMAANTGRKDLRDAADLVALELRKAQEPDGYLGTELPENRLKPDWPLWMHWYAMKGLRTHSMYRGDAESLAAARRGADWVVRDFSPLAEKAPALFRGASDGASNTALLDELAELYRITGEKSYLKFAEGVIAAYPLLQIACATGKAPRGHAYSQLGPLGGAVLVAQVSGNTTQLHQLEIVWEDIVAHHLFPTGSLSIHEGLNFPPNDIPDGWLQETCATVEWMIFNHRLYCATGNIRYMHAIERTIRNALLGAQSNDGMKWTYFTPLSLRKKWLYGLTQCCFYSGPRGIARLPEMIYHTDAEGVRVDLFESSTVKLTIQGQSVAIHQESKYPIEGSVRLIVRTAQPTDFAIKIRLPEHIDQPKLALESDPAPIACAPGKYATVKRVWKDGECLVLTFDPRVWMFSLPDGSGAICRGEQVLSLDQRDNPSVELNQVHSIDPVRLVALPAGPDGRARYRCQMMVLGTQVADVILTPFAEAGNEPCNGEPGDPSYRTTFPKQAEKIK